jgi:CubicO group peptidase (beta-lactamase class C family)
MIEGHCDPAFADVRSAFAEALEGGLRYGAALAVYLDDRLVVDLWGGVADPRTGRRWLCDTPSLAFSCTKAVIGSAALKLAERGAYETTGPVTRWWPEFGAHGKENATVEHFLTHQTGVPAFDRAVSAEEAYDPVAMAALLAAQKPDWRPGTDHGYHATTYGWLVSELVRRHVGRPLGDVVRDEIAGPLNLDMCLGAPDQMIDRAAVHGAGDDRGQTEESEEPMPVYTGTAAGKLMSDFQSPDSLVNRAFNIPNARSLPGYVNNRGLLRAGWPAQGLLTTARALAGFYQGLLAGRILDRATLKDAIRPRVTGSDRVMSIDSSYGLGFMRPSLLFYMPKQGWKSAFGYNGPGGCIGFGDLDHGLSVGYLTNSAGSTVGDRSAGVRRARIMEAAYAASRTC